MASTDTFQGFILPTNITHVVLGLSGGADSVALLRMLLERGVKVYAVHCNFQLRGDESLRDENFVRHLCDELHVPLEVVHFDTLEEAQRRQESVEMAARRLRYAYFDKVCEEQGADAICVAHHRDDNVETFLLNLFRGSGIDGLVGMKADGTTRGSKRLLRPLLDVTHQEIESYLQRLNQPFVVDSTNEDTHYRRNHIRHNVLPLLRETWPSVDSTLAKTMTRLSEVQNLCRQSVQQWLNETLEETNGITRLPISTLQQNPSRTTILHYALGEIFPPNYLPQIAHLIDAEVGRFVQYGDAMVVRAHDALEWGDSAQPYPPRAELVLDADKVVGRLSVRRLLDGDRIRPAGSRCGKLVNDYLSSRRLSLLQRRRVRLLCDEKGIVAIVGYTIDQRVSVSDKTRTKMKVQIADNGEIISTLLPTI